MIVTGKGIISSNQRERKINYKLFVGTINSGESAAGMLRLVLTECEDISLFDDTAEMSSR